VQNPKSTTAIGILEETESDGSGNRGGCPRYVVEIGEGEGLKGKVRTTSWRSHWVSQVRGKLPTILLGKKYGGSEGYHQGHEGVGWGWISA